ncbi:MAG: HEAT repeat domain-containing protein [Planctomycetota bacterium]
MKAFIVLVTGLIVMAASMTDTACAVGDADEAKIRDLIEDLGSVDDGKEREGKPTTRPARNEQAYYELRDLGERAIPYLEQALNDSRKDLRWRATQLLGATMSPKAIAPLVKAASDSDRDVRYYAVCFLTEHAKKSAPAAAALKKALKDSDARVMCAAVSGLERIGDPGFKQDNELFERLINLLDITSDADISYPVQALGMIGDARACGPLIKAMARSKYPDTVGWALIRIGSKEACKPLLRAMKDNPDKACVVAMGRTLSRLPHPSADNELLVMTKSQFVPSRQGAAEALGFAGNTSAVKRLAEMLADKAEKESVRESVASALGRIGGDDAAAVLARVFSRQPADKIDAPEHVRRRAAGALGLTRSTKALEPLLAALEDKEVYVVMHAARSLGHLGDPKAVLALLALLDRPDALDVRASSVDFANIATVVDLALKRIANPKVHPMAELISKPEDLQRIRRQWTEKFKVATQPTTKPST